LSIITYYKQSDAYCFELLFYFDIPEKQNINLSSVVNYNF